MAKKSLDRVVQAVESLENVRTSFSQPMHVIIGEAFDLARFVKTFWEPAAPGAGTAGRPGLSSVETRLSRTTAEDLVAEAEALQAAQTEYALTASPLSPDVRQRAEFLVGELSAALEFLFDDGVQNESDEQFAHVRQLHSVTPDSIDALSAELADYAELANRHAAELSEVANFDKHLIAEARDLVRRLRDREPGRATPAALKAALEKRDRIATVLVDHVARVRAGGRYVFRHHPEIARQATSAYERRRRAEARRAAAKKGSGGEGNTAGAGAVGAPGGEGSRG
jgi:hypothetical protein